MKKHMITKITISILTIILLITGTMLWCKIKYNQRKAPERVTTADIKAEEKEEDIKILEDELKNISKLLVLEGTTETKITYSDKQAVESDNFQAIKEWFAESKARELKVNCTYRFGFSYDMKYIKVDQINGKTYIYISRDNLDLEYLELIKANYIDDIGWLSDGEFSPNEVAALTDKTNKKSENIIRSKKELRDKAIIRVKEEVNNLLTKLGISAEVKVSSYDVVEQEE